MRRTYLKLFLRLTKVNPRIYSWGGATISLVLFLVLLWSFELIALAYVFFAIEMIFLGTSLSVSLYNDRKIGRKAERIYFKSLERYKAEIEEWKKKLEHYENG